MTPVIRLYPAGGPGVLRGLAARKTTGSTILLP